jgi:hypothetical protein
VRFTAPIRRHAGHDEDWASVKAPRQEDAMGDLASSICGKGNSLSGKKEREVYEEGFGCAATSRAKKVWRIEWVIKVEPE